MEKMFQLVYPLVIWNSYRIWPFCLLFCPWSIVIFHSHVSLPEGILCLIIIPEKHQETRFIMLHCDESWWPMVINDDWWEYSQDLSELMRYHGDISWYKQQYFSRWCGYHGNHVANPMPSTILGIPLEIWPPVYMVGSLLGSFKALGWPHSTQ